MKILEYVNLIRVQLGEKELERVTIREVEEYLGVVGKEKYLREEYIEREGYREIHPVIYKGKEKGVLIGRAVHSYTIIGCEMYVVLVGDNYDIRMATGAECEKRIDSGAVERYMEFKRENDKLIRRGIYRYPVGSEILVGVEKYKYLGIYSPIREVKKIVLEKKENREVVYYNAVEIFKREVKE